MRVLKTSQFLAGALIPDFYLLLSNIYAMSAINDNVYARVREKVKEKNLSEQELKAVDTAREQLQTHSKSACHRL